MRAAKRSAEIETQARSIIQLWHKGIRLDDWSEFDSALHAASTKPWFKRLDFTRDDG